MLAVHRGTIRWCPNHRCVFNRRSVVPGFFEKPIHQCMLRIMRQWPSQRVLKRRHGGVGPTVRWMSTALLGADPINCLERNEGAWSAAYLPGLRHDTGRNSVHIERHHPACAPGAWASFRVSAATLERTPKLAHPKESAQAQHRSFERFSR